MNIEQLVKQSGGEIRQPEAHFTEYVFSPKAIEAFAKALQQQSEPCSSCNDTGDIHSADGQYVGNCPCKQSSEPVLSKSVLKRHAVQTGTVSLAQYNKLLDALKDLFADYKALADSGDAGFWKLEETEIGKRALQAIAEAEGKEG